MAFVLLLHILIEAAVGILFLFVPAAGNLVPGFEDGAGEGYLLLMKMYGLAALFLAAVGVFAYLKRITDTALSYQIMLWLAIFHFAMGGIQLFYNSDQRPSLLHLLMGLFLIGLYIRRPGGKMEG